MLYLVPVVLHLVLVPVMLLIEAVALAWSPPRCTWNPSVLASMPVPELVSVLVSMLMSVPALVSMSVSMRMLTPARALASE